MFPCFREKPVFSTRDARLDKRNLFLLSGRAAFRSRHKILQKSRFQVIEKNNFQILTICENQLSKSQIVKIKLCKDNHGVQLSLYILKLSIFSCDSIFSIFFVIPVHPHYLTFCFKFYFPIADIIVNHLYILFLRLRKINTKC